MERLMMFGRENWWLKNMIYRYLIEDKEYYGIDNIRICANPHNVNILYKLCNLVKAHIDCSAVDNKKIMAVLYKIDFDIAIDGRLQKAIDYDDMKKEWIESNWME